MTHYATLGVGESATPEEIKRAYRRLASQHHPDRGGDTATFQTIQAAYDVISDADRRAQYDHERANPGGIKFNFNGQPFSGVPPGMESIFEQFGFNFGGGAPWHTHQPRRNKDLRIEITVDLASTLADQTRTVSIQTTNGDRQTVEVHIPRGILPGSNIKYPELGDNFFANLSRGDLYVFFNIDEHRDFAVAGLDLIKTVNINCLSAITGDEVAVTGLDNTVFQVRIPAGIQPNTVMRIPEQGLWQLNGVQRGHLLIKIEVTVPKNLTDKQLNLINQVQRSL
jgi:DnaJ-class molecular chaperone